MSALFPELVEDVSEYKVCRTCGEEKHVKEFHVNMTSWSSEAEVNGVRYRDDCKECRKNTGDKDAQSAAAVMRYHNLVRRH